MRRHNAILMILWLFGLIINPVSAQHVFAFVINGPDWTYQTTPMGQDYMVNPNYAGTID